jgi:two-component system CheB/CheR fusion protein
MVLKHIKSVEEFTALLKGSEQDRKEIVQDFLIGVTEFFRNPDAFAFIKQTVLIRLLENDQPSFRIWIPGCSTGQEVFSLAMMIQELREERGDVRPWKLFGTDFDFEALTTARRGVYAAEDLAPVSPERRARFFSVDANLAEISPELKKMCVFAPHDVLNDPPFSKIDLVSCRNLMIYIAPDGQNEILARFHYALNRDGFLWLGPSESLAGSPRLFEPINHAARVFRREDVSSSIKPPFLNFMPSFENSVTPLHSGRSVALRRTQVSFDIEEETEQAFILSFAPPFARISHYDEVLYASETMRPLLRPSKGVPSAAVDDYFIEPIRMPLRRVLTAIRQNREFAEVTDVLVKIGGKLKVFDILARRLDEDAKSVLVTFQPVRVREHFSEGGANWSETQEAYESELASVRKRLVAREQDFEMAEQELRANNEELFTMNEELQSSNEELETSREELQSINEELETINTELIENNKRLAETSSNIQNLLESTDIATLFIDNTGALRLFTPRCTELFALQERDVGRSIFDLSTVLDYPDLKTDLENAGEKLAAFSREVMTTDRARTFLTRLRPYRDVNGRIDGAVVSFIEITEQREQERQQRGLADALAKQVAEMEAFTESAPIGVGFIGTDMRFVRVNQFLAETIGMTVGDIIGRSPDEIFPKSSRGVKQILNEVLASGKAKLNVEVNFSPAQEGGPSRFWIENYFPIFLDTGKFIGIGITALEITRSRQLELNLRDKQRELAELEPRILAHFEKAPIQVIIFEGADHVIVHANECARQAIGHPNPIGKVYDEVSEGFDITCAQALDQVLRTGETRVDDEVVSTIRDEAGAISRKVFRVILQPYFAIEQTIKGVFLLALDVTQIVEIGEQHQAAQLRIRAIIDSLDSQILLLDRHGCIKEMNRRVTRSNSPVKSDLYGQRFWDLDEFKRMPKLAEDLQTAIKMAQKGQSVSLTGSIPHASDKSTKHVRISLVPLIGELEQELEVVASIVDETNIIEANAHKDIMVAELEHRVKNVFANIQAVVRFTTLSDKNVKAMASELDKHLSAMAHIHERLTETGWQSKSIVEVLTETAENHLGSQPSMLQVTGDHILLSPSAAMIMALAFSELLTNSCKYGALSVRDGRIKVETLRSENGKNRLLWSEHGVRKPTTGGVDGFGMLLLKKIVPMEFAAQAAWNMQENGIVYELNWLNANSTAAK